MSQIHTVRTASDVRELVSAWRANGQSVALVPTLGNLHAGHLSLVELARATSDRVVVSIFVNPTQFGPGEDFGAYPRTLDEDVERLRAAGAVAAVFVPAVEDIYPFGLADAVRILLPPLSRELCGASRPGHFDGVASVVCRLLNIVAPDLLVLGEKDYQQLILVQHLVADLGLAVRVLAGPTHRESDGLAMSSRNRYLTSAERARAPLLHSLLEQAAGAVRDDRAEPARVEADAVEALAAAGFRPDYVEVRRAADLAKPRGGDAHDDLIVLGAAWVGRARLIDNARV